MYHFASKQQGFVLVTTLVKFRDFHRYKFIVVAAGRYPALALGVVNAVTINLRRHRCYLHSKSLPK